MISVVSGACDYFYPLPPYPISSSSPYSPSYDTIMCNRCLIVVMAKLQIYIESVSVSQQIKGIVSMPPWRRPHFHGVQTIDSRESDSTIAKVCPSVCQSVSLKSKPLSLSESYLLAIIHISHHAIMSIIHHAHMTFWLIPCFRDF